MKKVLSVIAAIFSVMMFGCTICGSPALFFTTDVWKLFLAIVAMIVVFRFMLYPLAINWQSYSLRKAKELWMQIK